MGIKGLRALIEKHAPGAVREGVKLADLAGSTFVIDASLRIFKWTLVKNAHEEDETNVGHITGAFALTDVLRQAGIRSIYVFDGAPPEEKGHTIAARDAAREDGRARTPAGGVWRETRELLDMLGIVHFTADGEADPVVAHSTLHADNIYAMTDDLDALAFGARRVVLDVNLAKATATVITLADVLDGMGISYASFIDMCIFIGCDYTETKVSGIGPAKAYKLIKEYGEIDTALLAEDIGPDPGFTWTAARAVFLARPPSELRAEFSVRIPGIPDGQALRDWLEVRMTLNKRMRDVLKKIGR